MPVPSPPLGRALVSALALPGFTGTSLKASAGAGRAGAVRMGVLRWLTASALCIAVWGESVPLRHCPCWDTLGTGAGVTQAGLIAGLGGWFLAC